MLITAKRLIGLILITLVSFWSVFATPAFFTQAAKPPKPRVNLRLSTDEPEAVLAIIDEKIGSKPIDESRWMLLFSTEAYVRLKKREADLHRDFTDEEFKAFVVSDKLAERRAALRSSLDRWKATDLNAVAARVLGYLPENARLRAKIFPVIKPKENSFVDGLDTDPAIFLYLDPAVDQRKFENTIAHELHHIGYASVSKAWEEKIAGFPQNERAAIEWISAFGEGFAMLAAAGSPDVHPHETSKPEDRARWDRDMGRFNEDLKDVERFFMDVLQGRLKTEEAIQKKGYAFMGVQGSWYTVGYKMAVMVEKRFGRRELIACMLDPHLLLSKYNEAAMEHNRSGQDRLATWSPELLKAIGIR